MGASKTKVVGGSPTTQLGQNYSSFLGNALGQTGDASQAIHGLLNGQIGQGNPLYSGGYNIPQLASQVGQVQAPQINLGQFSQGLGTQVTQPQLNLGNFSGGQFQAPQIGQFQPHQMMDPNVNGSYAQAIQGVLGNQMQQNLADLHARYSAGGAGGVANAGTPEATADAIYRANALPQIGQALGQINMQQSGLDLQNAAQNQQGLLQNLGLQSSNALQGQGLNLQNLGQLLSAGMTQRGQDLTSGVESRGLDINQMGLLGSLAGQNASNNLQGQGMNAGNMLQMLGLGQNYNLGMGGLNLQNQGQQLQGMLGALSPIMGGINNMAMAGTPQAQVVQQKSGLAQTLGTIGNLGLGIGSMMMGMPPGVGTSIGSMFGLGGGSNGFGGLSNDTLQGMNSMLPSFGVPNVWG